MNDKEYTGWFSFHRSFFNNPISKDPYGTYIWLHILGQAHWQNNKSIEGLLRGQLLITKGDFCEELGISLPTLRKWMNLFEGEGMITTKDVRTRLLITVTKWDIYQKNKGSK